MDKKLYKYVGQSYIDRIFATKECVTLKCSYPKDFNDPYELFLTIDYDERPEVLAFYADAIGTIPQLPTTCFSRSPSVIPMWAHYASSLQGFVLEIDEPTLSSHFPDSGFGDVEYLDEPDDSIKDTLYRAYEIGKPRYVYFLHKSVFSAAYYTKSSCWSYELERRMIVGESEVKQRDGLISIDVPNDCITAIICGPRASEQTALNLRDRAEDIGSGYSEMKIGRSSSTPFFFDSQRETHVFDGGRLAPTAACCAICKEPVKTDSEECSWCRIDEAHQLSAAARNPYRILANHGMLESYVEGMEKITRSHTEK